MWGRKGGSGSELHEVGDEGVEFAHTRGVEAGQTKEARDLSLHGMSSLVGNRAYGAQFSPLFSRRRFFLRVPN